MTPGLYNTKEVKDKVCEVLRLKNIPTRDMQILKKVLGVEEVFLPKTLTQDQYVYFMVYTHLKRSRQKLSDKNFSEVYAEMIKNPVLLWPYEDVIEVLPNYAGVQEIMFLVHKYIGYRPTLRTLRRWFTTCGLNLQINRRYSADELRQVISYRMRSNGT